MEKYRKSEKHYIELIGSWIENIREKKREIIKSSRETMRDFCLVSGAIVGGVFIILSSPSIHEVQGFLLIGVFLLSINIVYVFGSLIFTYNNERKGLLETKNEYVDPANEFVLEVDKFKKGESTEERVDVTLNKANRHYNNKFLEAREKNVSDKEFKKSHWKEISLVIFSLGIVLIFFGLFIPYLPSIVRYY